MQGLGGLAPLPHPPGVLGRLPPLLDVDEVQLAARLARREVDDDAALLVDVEHRLVRARGRVPQRLGVGVAGQLHGDRGPGVVHRAGLDVADVGDAAGPVAQAAVEGAGDRLAEEGLREHADALDGHHLEPGGVEGSPVGGHVGVPGRRDGDVLAQVDALAELVQGGAEVGLGRRLRRLEGVLAHPVQAVAVVVAHGGDAGQEVGANGEPARGGALLPAGQRRLVVEGLRPRGHPHVAGRLAAGRRGDQVAPPAVPRGVHRDGHGRLLFLQARHSRAPRGLM